MRAMFEGFVREARRKWGEGDRGGAMFEEFVRAVEGREFLMGEDV